MLVVALRRLLTFIPLLIGVAFVTYILSFYGPGDPLRIIMGENWASEEVYQSLRQQYGLDRPLVVQFGSYLWGAVHGELVGKALPVSAQLALVATLLIAVVGITLGVISALWHYRWPDALIGLLGVVAHSVPPFVLAPIVLVLLVLQLKIMNTPTGWHGIFSYQTLIAATLLGASPLLGVIRQTRTSVVEALSQDYVRTARAKGLTERAVLVRHVLRNGLAPVLTSLGLTFGFLLGGSVFVESAFSIPGLGQLFFTALKNNDYPVLTAATIVSAFWIMLLNLLVDLSYGALDPRVRS